ncbi:MAG: segregation/condensation protein A [Alicyclobacillus sp.]|nr:segregation/condensation protein A [Alicyclobacillus sp.]
MAYEVVLEQFTGPLDLLLHLIRRQEINIHDIPMALITEQFMDYLRAMEELSLEVTSEFLVMAATLLAIKSRMLLPRRNREQPDGEVAAEDPREELVRQLVEYQRAKWAAGALKSRVQLQSLVYTRPPADLRPYRPSGPPVTEVSMWEMVDAFRRLLLRLPKEPRVAEIKGQVIAVEDRMELVQTRLRAWGRTTFTTLLQGARTRAELVATFLAVLELMKLRVIRCSQAAPFAEIEIVMEEAPT